MFSSALVGPSYIVCSQDYATTTGPIFTKFGGKMAREAGKKRLEFGGNLDHHVTLGLGLQLGPG